jgi:DNA-binding SARP family transcriptional activator
VRRGSQRIPVSRRVLSLLLTLAVLGRVRREKLQELLWGDDAAGAGTNALKMLVSRARAQLGDPSAIVAENGFYALAKNVGGDYHDIQTLLRTVSPHGALTDRQRAALQTAYSGFAGTAASPEPVASIETAIAALRSQVAQRLGQDALERGDIAAALTIADDLRRFDPNDEAAYELLIRAYIRAGNTASAFRAYRDYSGHLMAELGIEPAFSLETLVQQTR